MSGKIGYEIFPDRFYSSYKKSNTKNWNESVIEKPEGLHQFDFYGGDIKGIIQKIEYLKYLNIDFLYLTPLFCANTNHRYDCTDFFNIDPILGTEEEVKELIKKLHSLNIRVVFDAVFNHISKDHRWVEEKKDYILKNNGKITYWCNVPNLPELNLENEELRNVLWKGSNSVIKKWMDIGVDDWRVDCAYEFGYKFCRELTESAHKNGDHKVIGEIWSYPQKWIDGPLDGVMNYYFRELIQLLLNGEINGSLFTKNIEKTVKNCKLENILNCWNILSSHDTRRLRKEFDKNWKNALALQFTLPGSPLIYYGEEIGLSSGGDPYCRQPMPWKIINENNNDLVLYKKWINLYKNSAALNSGMIKYLNTNNEKISCFLRYTDSLKEMKLIIVNPSDEKQNFRLITQESSLMNNTFFIDHFSARKAKITNSTVTGHIPPNSFSVYYPDVKSSIYNPYKRIL